MRDLFETIAGFLERCWAFIFVGLFFICTAVLYFSLGENSYIAIHDNLDLFIPQFQMMKNDGTFFALEAGTDFLNGISRNVLPSEFSLYTVLYMIFPAFKAYIVGYFIKIIIAMIGSGLLCYDIIAHEGLDTWTKKGVYYIHPIKRDYTSAVSLAVLVSFAYGILNLFPAFGIPFAAIPLIVYLFRKAYLEPSFWKFFLIFCYPFLSYFSYHSIFIMGYLVIAIIWIWVRNQKFPWQLALGLVLLAVGSVLCEYRLFATMLFSNEVTIRSTMVEANLSVIEILKEIGMAWAGGMMHANDAHLYIVLPTCVIYFFYYSDDDYQVFGYYRKSASENNMFVNGKETLGNSSSADLTGTGIGTGEKNTELLVKAMGDKTYASMGANKKVYAAKLCYDLVFNGFDDWFLPSKEELNLLYVNLCKEDMGDFDEDAYWSSSETDFSADYAWRQEFYGGGKQSYGTRDYADRIRPVRAF